LSAGALSAGVSGRPELLRHIAEGTAWATGTEFFRALVAHLASALDASCAFVTEFVDSNALARPLAFWHAGEFIDAPDYPLAGSPCESVLSGDIAAFPDHVCDLFPVERDALRALGAVSYVAIPIEDAAGVVVGHLAAIDRRARDWSEVDCGILRIFSARAAGELGRRWYERALVEAEARLHEAIDDGAASEAALRRVKSAFLATMSHELRTPLNGILGYAQLLARDRQLDSRHAEAVQGLQNCGEQLLELVNEVLDLARIEAGRFEKVDPDLPEMDARVIAAPPRATVTGYHGRRRVLLVADDGKDNRAVLRGLLEPLGFEIHEATNGLESLDLARRAHPDLILLDLVMPELDGFEVARRLRRDPALGGIPVIAVSASVFDDTRQASLKAGCDDFLAKPVALDALLARLERHLGLRWIRSAGPATETPSSVAPEPAPPAPLVARLLELARSGDIAGVHNQLAQLDRGARHPRLVAELRAYARAFDMKGLRDRLQSIEPSA
jgi:CheY-like chemotaxis protein